MKIRKKKDIEALDQRIQDELGIDVKMYRNQELVDNAMEIMVFPMFVASWAGRTLLAFMALYILGFFLIDLYHVLYFVYGLFGFILFFLSGIVMGVLVVILKIRTELCNIADYILQVLKTVVLDVRKLQTEVKGGRKPSYVLKLLFLGLTHIVFIPVLTGAISKRVKFFAFIPKWIVKKNLSRISQ